MERTRTPDLTDHIGFANFDLRSNGLPEIERAGEKLKLFVPNTGTAMVQSILRQHGFEFE
jgi:hypothetical protein